MVEEQDRPIVASHLDLWKEKKRIKKKNIRKRKRNKKKIVFETDLTQRSLFKLIAYGIGLATLQQPGSVGLTYEIFVVNRKTRGEGEAK